MKPTPNKQMKLEQLHKVGSECELNSWPDSSVGYSVWTEFSGRGFKSRSGQLSIATSKNPSVVYINIYITYILYIYIYIYIYITYIYIVCIYIYTYNIYIYIYNIYLHAYIYTYIMLLCFQREYFRNILRNYYLFSLSQSKYKYFVPLIDL